MSSGGRTGILALLDEDEVELKTYALERLDGLVNEFWAEVADGISKMCVASTSAFRSPSD